jgi:hypothetical protein
MDQSTLWKPSILPTLKSLYGKRLDFFGVDEQDKSRFIWAGEKRIQLFVIQVSYKGSQSAYVVFARATDGSDSLIYTDARSQTNNYDFEQLVQDPQRLDYLVEQKVIPKRITETIEAASLDLTFVSSIAAINSQWIYKWVSNEYDLSKAMLEERNRVAPFPLSNQKIFVERFHFDKMVEAIGNDQFADEFNQCLTAYNDGYWFLCSVGLGTCIEHLLLLTLQNSHSETELQKQLGWDPTGSKYTSLLMKPPVKMSIRQAKYIRLLFAARNSVDHHNTGYTSKNLCDILLDGIANIFNDYYQPSMAFSQPKK